MLCILDATPFTFLPQTTKKEARMLLGKMQKRTPAVMASAYAKNLFCYLFQFKQRDIVFWRSKFPILSVTNP